jgi:endonuclease YncB( thermonuclease family)
MTVTNRAAEKQDLGDASVAILAAYIKDTGPICTQVLSTADIVYVTCYALIGGQYLDLAMILISSGFATASLHQNGQPLYAPYASAESKAWQHRAGLWQFMPKIEH